MEEADIMEMITGSEFAKKIKELALKNNKTIKKVLKDCGINRNYIYDLENILLRNSKEIKYTPKLDFNGKTECRTLNFNYAEAH